MRDPASEDIYKEEIKGISNTFQKHLKHLTKLKPRNLQRRILLPFKGRRVLLFKKVTTIHSRPL